MPANIEGITMIIRGIKFHEKERQNKSMKCIDRIIYESSNFR